jgi:hypothetical protein
LGKQAKALLVWEGGTGFTHAQNIWGVVRHLQQAGVTCVVSLNDLRFAPWFHALGCPVLQSWLQPVLREGFATPEPQPARVYSDVLANQGFFDPAHLAGAIAHYDALFDLARPDLVLCENAPAALVAARGGMPVLAFGSTLSGMPPVIGPDFAPVDPAAPEPSHAPEALLTALNQALSASGRPAWQAISDLLRDVTVLPFGPAAFDPYRHARASPVLPPHCPDLDTGTVRGTERTIAVYLHEAVQYLPDIMEGLRQLPRGSRLYLPMLTDAHKAAFVAKGLVVETDRFALADLAANAGCLLHHGGVTLTAAMLALGVPQVILPRFFENGIAARYVAEQGLGAFERLDRAEPAWISDAACSVIADDDLQQRALDAAPFHQTWFSGDPTAMVAHHVIESLGLGPWQAAEPNIAPPRAGFAR